MSNNGREGIALQNLPCEAIAALGAAIIAPYVGSLSIPSVTFFNDLGHHLRKQI
jgi:hypothetical protein